MKSHHLLILLLFFCCTNEKEATLLNFKKQIGLEDSRVVDQFMESMETKFRSIYEVEDLNDAYRSYLLDIVLGDSHLEFDQEDCKELKEYEASDLIDKYVIENFDEIYMDENLVVSIFEFDTTWHIRPFGKTLEEFRTQIMNEGYRHLTHLGTLTDAIKSVNQGDSIVSSFVERKELVGTLNHELCFPPFLNQRP